MTSVSVSVASLTQDQCTSQITNYAGKNKRATLCLKSLGVVSIVIAGFAAVFAAVYGATLLLPGKVHMQMAQMLTDAKSHLLAVKMVGGGLGGAAVLFGGWALYNKVQALSTLNALRARKDELPAAAAE